MPHSLADVKGRSRASTRYWRAIDCRPTSSAHGNRQNPDPAAPWRAEFHLGHVGCAELAVSRWNSTLPGVSSAAAYHTTAGEMQKMPVPWRAEFHLGHWGWQRARRVEMELDIPRTEQRCGLSHDRRRNAEGAGSLEGRVPPRPCGLRRELAVSRWNSTFPGVSSAAAYHTTAGEMQKMPVPWSAEFHLGQVGCGRLAVSRWNSTPHPRFARSVQTEPVSAMIPIHIDRLRGTDRHHAHQRAAKPTAWIDPVK